MGELMERYYETDFVGGPRDGESLTTQGPPPFQYEMYSGPADPLTPHSVHRYRAERTINGYVYRYKGTEILGRADDERTD